MYLYRVRFFQGSIPILDNIPGRGGNISQCNYWGKILNGAEKKAGNVEEKGRKGKKKEERGQKMRKGEVKG